MPSTPTQEQEQDDEGDGEDKNSNEEKEEDPQQGEEEDKGKRAEYKGQGETKVTTTRRVSVIAITLSFAPLDTSHIGYQPPLPPEELNVGGGGGRGAMRGRTGERGGYAGRVSYWYQQVQYSYSSQ